MLDPLDTLDESPCLTADELIEAEEQALYDRKLRDLKLCEKKGINGEIMLYPKKEKEKKWYNGEYEAIVEELYQPRDVSNFSNLSPRLEKKLLKERKAKINGIREREKKQREEQIRKREAILAKIKIPKDVYTGKKSSNKVTHSRVIDMSLPEYEKTWKADKRKQENYWLGEDKKKEKGRKDSRGNSSLKNCSTSPKDDFYEEDNGLGHFKDEYVIRRPNISNMSGLSVSKEF